jgi:hypothetical protein
LVARSSLRGLRHGPDRERSGRIRFERGQEGGKREKREERVGEMVIGVQGRMEKDTEIWTQMKMEMRR